MSLEQLSVLQTVPVFYRKNQPESDSKPRGKKQLRTSTDKETEVKEIEFGGGGGCASASSCLRHFPGFHESGKLRIKSKRP